jgi:hypothetical protein
MRVFIVTMERTCDREGHHYNIGLYTDLAKAFIDGEEHGRFHRANKYVPRIEECVVDSEHLKEVPYAVARDYAKMKFPERFDSESRLIEQTGDQSK